MFDHCLYFNTTALAFFSMSAGFGREKRWARKSARLADISNSALYIRCSITFCRRISNTKAIFGYSRSGQMARQRRTEDAMDHKPLGAVVVGTGFGVLTHVRAMQAAGIEVLALVGRDAAKTSDRAARFGVPHATTDLAEALALTGVDAVAVATPPHTHGPIVLAAIAAGKHVVCEKPFARDATEAERMLDAAERAGVIHLLGTEFQKPFRLRWTPNSAADSRCGVCGQPLDH